MHTYNKIVEDLKTLGVESGGTYLLRVSYRAIGKIEGGPKAFLKAMLEVVGPEGTIIMTAFPPKHITQLRFLHRRKVYNKENPPKPFTGVMPVIAMTLPSAKLSEKLEFAFVVIGKYAEYLTSNHTHEKKGYWLLREAMNKFDAKCLRIGGETLFGSTHMAIEDVFAASGATMKKLRLGLYLLENKSVKWYDEPNITFCHNAFAKYTNRITAVSKEHEGYVGNGYAIITNMNLSYKEELSIYTNNLHELLCSDPNCLLCRTSYSFSDSTNAKYLYSQLKRLFSREYKSAIISLYEISMKILFAKESK